MRSSKASGKPRRVPLTVSHGAVPENGYLRAMVMQLSVFWLLLGAAFGALASTGNQAMDWVQKMSSSMQELSYQGRFVYVHNGQLESMSVVHIRQGDDIRERLTSLNGEAREILRDNSNLTCVWPSSRQVVVDPSSRVNKSPLWIPDDVRRLSKFYDFQMQGKDRIAGHPSVVIAIVPRDEFRYGMKVWIDETHGLLLQSIVFDEEGLLSEQIMFTDLGLIENDDLASINVMPEIAHGFALIRSNDKKPAHVEAFDEGWQLSAIPLGFHIESSFQKSMPDDGHMVQQMVLSDGLASVSVFIEKLDDESLLGESSMGAINAYSTEHQGYSVTAIGEVPLVTVRSIADAVMYQP